MVSRPRSLSRKGDTIEDCETEVEDCSIEKLNPEIFIIPLGRAKSTSYENDGPSGKEASIHFPLFSLLFADYNLRILTDSGSRHNFLGQEAGKQTGCRKQKINPVKVAVANCNEFILIFFDDILTYCHSCSSSIFIIYKLPCGSAAFVMLSKQALL